MTAGLFLGLKAEAAARFSFLLSIPVILASGLFEVIKLYKDETLELQWVNMIIGGAISFIVALIVIHLFMRLFLIQEWRYLLFIECCYTYYTD